MSRWIDVALFELRMQFRRRAYTLLTFGLPILAVGGFLAYQFYQDVREDEPEPATPIVEEANEPRTGIIGYVDETPQGLFPPPESYPGEPDDCRIAPDEIQTINAEVIKRVSSPYCLRENIRAYESREAAMPDYESGVLDALYVIDESYLERGEVNLYVPNLTLESAERSGTLMEQYILSSLLYNTDAETFEELYLRLRAPATIGEHTLRESASANVSGDDGFTLVYVFGLILMLSLFWGGGYLMQSVVKEKENRVIEIILSSVKPVPLLLGKIMAMGLASLIQVATLLGAALFIMTRAGDTFGVLQGFEIDPQALVIAIVYFILGFLLFGSAMAAIGALTSSMRESQNYVTFVTLPAVIPFFFLTMFAEEPNGTFATVLSIFPLTSPLSMIMRAAVTRIPAWQLGLSLALLLLAVAFVIWLSGRLFRVNTLLSGTTPKFKDIPKLLRG